MLLLYLFFYNASKDWENRMKHNFIKNFIFILAISVPSHAWSAGCTLDASSCSLNTSKKCSSPPTQLDQSTYEIIGTDENCCCRLKCVQNASYTNGNCFCNANHYKNASSCDKCPNNYPNSAVGNNNSQNTCYKNCDECIPGANVQTCKRETETANAPNGECKYTTECYVGYHFINNSGGTATPACAGNSYTVKLYDGAKEIKSVQCTFGTTCSFEIEPQKSGSIFSGWALTNNGTPSFAITWLKGLPATWTPYTGTYPAIPGDNATINIYATWTNCTNEGATNAKEWDGNKCVIKTCNAGYYVHDTPDTDPVKNGCYTCPAGYYCPGENDGCSYTGSTDTNPHGICDCARGYYCTSGSGTGTACPMGTTTTSARATTSARCVMMMGDNGTKFCDSTGGCFTLPGTGSITATGR